MEILEQILKDKNNRSSLIKQFQELIGNDENANEIVISPQKEIWKS